MSLVSCASAAANIRKLAQEAGWFGFHVRATVCSICTPGRSSAPSARYCSNFVGFSLYDASGTKIKIHKSFTLKREEAERVPYSSVYSCDTSGIGSDRRAALSRKSEDGLCSLCGTAVVPLRTALNSRCTAQNICDATRAISR